MVAKSKKTLFLKPSWKLVSVVGLVVVSGLLMLELTNTTHLFHKPRAISETIPSTRPLTDKVSSNSTNSSSVTTGNSVSGNKQNSTAGSSGSVAGSGTSGTSVLLAPSGSGLVSNHHPSLSGSPDQLTEQSVCNTTAGASCYIKFVNNDGIVKTLASQVADSSGATYWDWDVNKSGFTTGSWTITAVASLNSQTKTTNDSLALEVQP